MPKGWERKENDTGWQFVLELPGFWCVWGAVHEVANGKIYARAGVQQLTGCRWEWTGRNVPNTPANVALAMDAARESWAAMAQLAGISLTENAEVRDATTG